MIKIMLVEDEPPILRDLKALIETTNPDFKVINCSYDGQQAISALKADIPDIIITDIQMPVVDGLELISYIKNNALDIVPIILSGYSEFEYARKAMSLGVESYLLKPINPKELSKLLSGLSIKIHTKRQNQKRDCISNLLEDNCNETKADSLDFKNSTYLLMLFCAGSFQSYSLDYHSPQKKFWESIDLEKFGSSLLSSSEEIWIFNGKTSAEKLILYTLSNDCSYERVNFFANSFLNYLIHSNTSITIIASPFIEKIQKIGSALQALRYILCKNAVIGFSQILKQYEMTEQNDVIPAKPDSISGSLIDKLVFSLKQGDILCFKSELRQTFEYLNDLRYPQIFIEKLLCEIILSCRKSMPNPPITNITDLELEISEAVYVSADYDELFNNLWYIFEELFEIGRNSNTDLNNTSVLMQKIERFIKDNVSEPINLQLLSEKFGLVPPYLSRLFKNFKGMSPIDYLTTLRIEKAKELIKTQNTLFTKDIASIVGYSDPLYFSKIFKKETGFSPSDYKNSGMY